MGIAKLKTQPCGSCGGTGVQPADDVGEMLAEEREEAELTRASVAEAMGISPEYLRELEKGTRRWSTDLVNRFRDSVKELANGRG